MYADVNSARNPREKVRLHKVSINELRMLEDSQRVTFLMPRTTVGYSMGCTLLEIPPQAALRAHILQG